MPTVTTRPVAKPAAAKAIAAQSAAAPGQTFIGQVEAFAFNFAPVGWLPCDGRLLAINQYQALFSLLGTTYGGDAERTFALPRLAPLGPSGPGYYIAIQATFPTRA